MAYLSVSGTNSWAEAAHNAAYNEASILDVRAEIDFDAYTGAIQSIVSRRVGSAAQSQFQFFLGASAELSMRIYDAAGPTETTLSNSGTGVTATPGTPIQVRVVVDCGSNTCDYYTRATGTALTSDSGWSQLGTQKTAGGAAALNQPSSCPIEIGATVDGQLEATGKFYRVVIKKGATSGGTLVFDADFSDTTTWTFA